MNLPEPPKAKEMFQIMFADHAIRDYGEACYRTAIEEAAKVADECMRDWQSDYDPHAARSASYIAVEIRALLKEQT